MFPSFILIYHPLSCHIRVAGRPPESSTGLSNTVLHWELHISLLTVALLRGEVHGSWLPLMLEWVFPQQASWLTGQENLVGPRHATDSPDGSRYVCIFTVDTVYILSQEAHSLVLNVSTSVVSSHHFRCVLVLPVFANHPWNHILPQLLIILPPFHTPPLY